MPDADDASVTRLIAELRGEAPEAARQLWERYFQRVVQQARQRLGRAPRRVADEEDVAVSVFQSLCEGIVQGRFDQLHDRGDLWRLLLTITRHKVADQVRRQVRQKRGGGQVRGESVFDSLSDAHEGGGLHAFLASDPPPEFLVSVEEQYQRLLALLPDASLRTVVRLKLEGHTNEEIAKRLDVSIRTVERKLRVIRQDWCQELS